MPLLQVIVLAVVQGITEFLPISSTAHLYLTSWLLGWQAEALDFDIALHIGTLLAILLYFLRDWLQVLAQGLGMRFGRDEELKQNRMMLWLLAVATVPVGVFGFVFNKQAETTWRNPYVMGVMLVAVGVLMWLAERAGRKRRDLSSLNLPDSVAIGVAQALSIVPGTSRSGITISAAAGKALYDMHKHGGLGAILNAPFLVGVGVSALTGCAVIAWFLHYLRRSSLLPFVYYRIIFGIIVLALAFIRRPA
jgi:undecaprenyl-diphosphatase